MNCADIRDLVTEYANGELTETRRQFVEDHLSSCPVCQSALAADNWVRDKLAGLRSMPAPNATTNIRNATMTTIETTQSRPVYRGGLVRRGIIAASIAAVFAIVLVMQLTGTGGGGGISAVYAATADIESFRITGTAMTTIGGETNIASFDWQFAAPDTYQGSVVSEGVITEFINVGDRQYSRDLGADSGGVVVITTEGNLGLFNPIRGTQGMLDILDTMTVIQGPDTISLAGQDVEYYLGALDIIRLIEKELDAIGLQGAERQEALTNAESLRSASINVELWVDPETSRIVRLKRDGRIPYTTSSSNGLSTTQEMILATDVTYAYPLATPDISAPVNSLGEPEPGWSRTR